MASSTLEDIFELLSIANTLEETGEQRIEAATKYYEAVYLIRTYVQRLPRTPRQADSVRLLTEKADHYERIAKDLIKDDSSFSGSSSAVLSPRSPIANETFFAEESSVVPLPAPPTASLPLMKVHSIAAQANAKLSQALDLDEQQRRPRPSNNDPQIRNNTKEHIIKAYMEAAELYLQAVQHAKQRNNTLPGSNPQDVPLQQLVSVVTRRLQQTLDRIEQLKTDKAIVPQDRLRDEHVKKKTTGDAAAVNTLSSRLTPQEIQILKQSSLMASGLFLPWSGDDALQLSQEAASAATLSARQQPTLFSDPQGPLPLNARQQKYFYKWARPKEIVQLRKQSGLVRGTQSIHVVHAISPFSIQQQFVTDCSFIASLCICAAFERRFGRQLVSSMLYPQRQTYQDAAPSIEPLLSPSGKYMVKLWLNGVARSVIIDDTLPVDQYGNLLCSISNGGQLLNPSCAPHLELWVSLIEKAYMKLCGGYDFPGSNSGVDLFSVTGWIPERILFAQDPEHVRDFEIAPERVWDRIAGASSFGDCLVTVSTEPGRVQSEEITETGLVTGHAYAVLNVTQTRDGTRLLLLKNPWGRQEWKGKYSCYDRTSWTPSLCHEIGYTPRLDRAKEDGVFWISWQDILSHFQNFHLSWNPQLFSHRVVRHGFWARDVAPDDDSYNIGENPQHVLVFSEDGAKRRATVWILVSRHVNRQEQEGCEVSDYLTVHIHRNSAAKERIWYPGKAGNCVLVGAYTNNPHVLVRYDLQGREDRYLSLVLSQYKKSHDLAYTISCYCTDPFTLTQPVKELPFHTKLSSQWTETKCGGPLGTKFAHENPQFAVAVPLGGATMQISITTVRTCAVCIVLVPVSSYGCAATSLMDKPVVDTGKYRHGFVVSNRVLVPHGAYALLVTSFHPGTKAGFELKISSSAKLKIQEIR